MTEAELAVAEARAWLGTPYHHQMAVRAAGCDCLGLIRGVWRALYGTEPARAPSYSPDWGEVEGAELLLTAAMRHLVPKARAAAMAGDVLVFRMAPGAIAKHVGLQSRLPDPGRAGRFIHAHSGAGVVESRLTPAWEARIVARFAWPARSRKDF